MNPIHIPKPCFPEIHLDVVFPSAPRSFQWSPPFRLPNQNVVCTPHLYVKESQTRNEIPEM
jgi:hypothetical protein